MADLAGKSVSIGAQGSGVWFNAVDVLGAYGIDAETGIKPVYQSFGESTESLKDGKIDAAFIVAGAPTTAIVDLAAAWTRATSAICWPPPPTTATIPSKQAPIDRPCGQ